jgi:hypothetical protein
VEQRRAVLAGEAKVGPPLQQQPHLKRQREAGGVSWVLKEGGRVAKEKLRWRRRCC